MATAAVSGKSVKKTSEVKEKEIDNEKDECTECGKKVTKDGIQCEICDKWNHSKCAGIKPEVYEFISSNVQTHWFCSNCNEGTGKMIKEIKRLQERVENIESQIAKQKEESKKEIEKILDSRKQEVQKELEKMAKDMKEIQKEINKVLQSADSQISTSIKKQEVKWSEVVAKQVETELKMRSTEVETMNKGLVEAKVQYDDMQDKEKRRNNIIIYRAKESSAVTAEERNDEDEKFCLGLFHTINSGVDKEDISKVIRLGRRGDDASQPPRPILVQLASRLSKNLIMEKLYQLKHAEAKFKSVMVANDMTKKEREEVRTLVAESKELNKLDTSGEWIHLVRGQSGQMKIIKVKKSN